MTLPRPEHINDWEKQVAWVYRTEVEKDLILSGVLIDIFDDPFLKENVAFRGGTALNKVHRDKPYRYSEDIDLVLLDRKQLAPVMNTLLTKLDWIGRFKDDQTDTLFKRTYTFRSHEENKGLGRLKVEVNLDENEPLFDLIEKPYALLSPWKSGEVFVKTYCLDEMLGTKMRALYQRDRGRDLVDLGIALEEGTIDPELVVKVFNFYRERKESPPERLGTSPVAREDFREELTRKTKEAGFCRDVASFVGIEQLDLKIREYSQMIDSKLIERLPLRDEVRQQYNIETKKPIIRERHTPKSSNIGRGHSQ